MEKLSSLVTPTSDVVAVVQCWWHKEHLILAELCPNGKPLSPVTELSGGSAYIVQSNEIMFALRTDGDKKGTVELIPLVTVRVADWLSKAFWFIGYIRRGVVRRMWRNGDFARAVPYYYGSIRMSGDDVTIIDAREEIYPKR